MHNKRQIISNFSDHLKLSNFEDHRNIQSSLQQSPIAKQLSIEEDHSPQHIFYPTSLQIKQKKNLKNMNLKNQIVNLLYKLKDWLLQLCLTQACFQEINEQLQPVIYEINDARHQQSYYSNSIDISRSINHKIIAKSFILKYNKNNSFLDSNKTDSDHHQSINPPSQYQKNIMLLTQQQKQLLKLFFKNYHRLLQKNLQKINKYSGQKKLKFLISTIMRNIFSQTMRISYDLKILQHKVQQKKEQKFNRNLKSYILILKDRLSMIFQDKGLIKDSFKLLKDIYYDKFMKDQIIVYGMIDKINKFINIFQKNKKSILFKYTFNWRHAIHQIKVRTEISIVQQIKSKIYKIITSLFFFQNDKEIFSFYWKNSIEHHLNQLIQEAFEGQDCLYVSMQQILKQKNFKKQKEISVIEYLMEYEKSTEREYSFKDHLFLNQFTLEELKNCILSGEIYRNEKLSNNLLLVPIKSAPGIIFIRLSAENQNIFQSYDKKPMTLNSFRILLRVVQLISPLLQNLVSICKKIQKDWQQVQQNNHFQLLFKEYLRSTILSSQFNQRKEQYLIQNHQQTLLINSHRLQQTSETIKIILNKYQINCLMVYHYKDNLIDINQIPCIIYGDKEVPLTLKHIVHSIFNQLISSGKQYLVIVRNQKVYNILPIKHNRKLIGFINYTTMGQYKIQNQLLQECLVPLILKSQGSINCQQCKISLKIPKNISNATLMQPHQESYQSNNHLSSLLKIASSVSLLDLQQNCKTILRSKGNFFFKMIYKVNINENNEYFSIGQDKKIQFHRMQQDQRFNHHQGFTEEYLSLTDGSTYAKIVFKNPIFSNPQLHIFQYENLCTFRVQALPIKVSKQHYGYILIGLYLCETIKNNDLITFIKKLSIGINSNHNIFKIDNLQKQFQNNQKSSREEDQFIIMMKKKSIINVKTKLIDDLRTFSKNLQNISFQLWRDNKINVKLFKVNLQTQVLYPLNEEGTARRFINCPKQFIDMLNNSFVLTHERIYAGKCNFSKKYFSSAIKPSKINHLFNKSIFYPNINALANKQLKQYIKNRYKLQGWIANENLQHIEKIYQNLYGKFSNQNTYFVLNIGKQKDKKIQYLAILQCKIDQQNPKSMINQNSLIQIQQAYLNLFKRHQSFLHNHTTQKKQSIQLLQMMVRKGMTNQKVIKCFYLNHFSLRQNVKVLTNTISSVVCDYKNKNNKYFYFIKKAFKSLKQVNTEIIKKNQIFLTRIIPIISRYQAKCEKTLVFNELCRQTEQWRALWRQTKAINTIQSIINNLIHAIYKKSISIIKCHNNVTSYNKIISKRLSISKLSTVLQNLTKKQSYPLFQQFIKYHHIFAYYFRLISQQYQNIKFDKRQSFLRYSNQRFNNIISQINFAVLNKIEIMTGFIVEDKMVVHKIGQSNQLQTFTLDHDENCEKDRYQGFQMILVQQRSMRKHFVLYKLYSKYSQQSQKQYQIVYETMVNSIKPCYAQYLKTITQKAQKMSKIIMNIACKELWNSSTSNAQAIYAFGRNLCLEHQCSKLNFFNILKASKISSSIKDLKHLRQAINQQSKGYYKLEYEHNALTNALSSGVTNEILQEQSQMFNKYGQLITKSKLKQMRQQTQRFENMQQKVNLQYQIKSKTFSTLKSIVFCDKKQNEIREDMIVGYLTDNKQNANYRQQPNYIQKLYVQKKIQLKGIKENIYHEVKLFKKKSSRALWIILSKISRQTIYRDKKQVFSKLLYPRNKIINYRF